MYYYLIGVILSLYLIVLMMISKPEIAEDKDKLGTIMAVSLLALSSFLYVSIVFIVSIVRAVKGK